MSNRLDIGTKVTFFDSSTADYEEGYVVGDYVELLQNEDGKSKRINIVAYDITKLDGSAVKIHTDLIFNDSPEPSVDKVTMARFRLMKAGDRYSTWSYLDLHYGPDDEERCSQYIQD